MACLGRRLRVAVRPAPELTLGAGEQSRPARATNDAGCPNKNATRPVSTFECDIGYSRVVVDGDYAFVSGTTGFDYAAMTIANRSSKTGSAGLREHRASAGIGRLITCRCRASPLHRAERRRLRALLADAAPLFRWGAAGGDDDRCGAVRSAHEDRNRSDGPAGRPLAPLIDFSYVDSMMAESPILPEEKASCVNSCFSSR